jgi:hypothetical protein
VVACLIAHGQLHIQARAGLDPVSKRNLKSRLLASQNNAVLLSATRLWRLLNESYKKG